MDSLRIVLAIIGVLVIIGLLGHGLWTIRKNNQSARGERERVERKRRRQPEDLFSAPGNLDEVNDDIDPITPRAPRSRRPQREPEIGTGLDATESELTQMEIDLADDKRLEPTAGNLHAQEQLGLLDDDEPRVLTADEPVQPAEMEAVYAQTDSRSDGQSGYSDEVASDDGVQHTDDNFDTLNEEHEEVAEPELEVITLYITGDIQGAILLQMSAELGLKFGDMDIFHRHLESSGHGPVLFSLANMFNPGTFDLDAMEQFSTEGLVLFMTLPVRADGHQAFTMMYNAANKIADAMPRAAVLDANRNPVTKQSVQHTYQRIREFERKQRLHKTTL